MTTTPPNPLPCGCRVCSVRLPSEEDDSIWVVHCQMHAAAERLLAACELWDQGFTEGDQFTPEQFIVLVNSNRHAAREAIAAAKKGTTPCPR